MGRVREIQNMNVGIKNKNEKLFSFSFVIMFGLFFRTGIRIKNLLIWKSNYVFIEILIYFFYIELLFIFILILFSCIFALMKHTLKHDKLNEFSLATTC